MYKESLNELLSRPITRYVLVGGSAYILELIVIYVALHFGSSNLVAVALSFWIGLAYSFVLQKFFSFRDKRVHRKIVLPQLLMVTGLVIFNFLFTMAITKLLQSVLPTPLIRTIAIGMTTIWNFYLYKTRIFNKPVID